MSDQQRLADIKYSILNNTKRQPFDVQPPAFFGSERIHENYVFAESAQENSILIDALQFTENDMNGKAFGTLLREHYPDAIGIKFGTTPRKHIKDDYVEVIFGTASASEKALLKKTFVKVKTEGPYIPTITTKPIYVSKPLPKNSKVIHIDISGIPFQETPDIHNNILNVFAKYGEVLKMGIYVSEEGRWFTGSGYITLIADKSKNNYEKLPKSQIEYEGVTYSIQSHFLN